MSDIARVKEQALFVKLETTPGTLAIPASGDCVVLASSMSASQSPSYTDSPEIQNTRGVISRFQDALSAGEFGFSIIPRANAAGMAPVGAPLFRSLMGAESVVADTSVTYSQTLKKPSLSICYRKGHVVYYLLGATLGEMSVKAEKKGAVTLDLKGKFMRRLIMADDKLTAGAALSATDLIVEDAGRFMVGGRIFNFTLNDSNSNQGYEITAVETATNTVTIATGISQAWNQNDEIKGYLPPDQTVGTPIEGRDTVIKLDGTAGMIQSMDLSINDPCEYLEDEINGVEYPTEYVEGDRNITGTLKSYFRKEYSSKLVSALEGSNEVELAFEFGDANQAGKQMIITLPRVPLEAPSEEESGPSVTLSQNFTALETNGEDSCSIVFQ